MEIHRKSGHVGTSQCRPFDYRGRCAQGTGPISERQTPGLHNRNPDCASLVVPTRSGRHPRWERRETTHGRYCSGPDIRSHARWKEAHLWTGSAGCGPRGDLGHGSCDRWEAVGERRSSSGVAAVVRRDGTRLAYPVFRWSNNKPQTQGETAIMIRAIDGGGEQAVTTLTPFRGSSAWSLSRSSYITPWDWSTNGQGLIVGSDRFTSGPVPTCSPLNSGAARGQSVEAAWRPTPNMASTRRTFRRTGDGLPSWHITSKKAGRGRLR